ncbi:MAG: mannitol dehydrogenase family protein [Planctomycetaceae bacterium]|nr:mannitol dehydrogenase family protein [Planctomycetaceae bacterium]
MNEAQYTWLHIGAGSFHRAHQAWYLHTLRQMGKTDWAIALGNIRDDVTPMLEKLAAQGCDYTLETVTPSGERAYERISSIRRVAKWDKDLTDLTAIGAAPGTRVIAFTVTESGYYLDTSFRLDQGNPDIAADLGGGHGTIYGTIALLLKARREAAGGPVTLLSCDNVRHNGTRFRQGLLEFLRLRGDNDLAAWAEANTTSPCCIVDRITPRPGPDIAPRVLAVTGFADAVPVMGESFIQWVVEDDFIAGRPELELAGVEMVEDVEPYEEAKIRILNVTHAGVAWAGTLRGIAHIHEDMAVAPIREMASRYVTDDVIPCLQPSPLNFEAYRDTVMERFGNPYILDTNQRVGADGFSKIPAMVTPTLRECYARGTRPAATAVLGAVFYEFLRMWHTGKLPYPYQDGVMDEDAVHALFAAEDPVGAFAADAALFGELAGQADFKALLRESVSLVRQTFLP